MDLPAGTHGGICCRDAVGHQPASSSQGAARNMLPGLSSRKCDSPEHLICFGLVDMLNLKNDSVSLFILAFMKLRSKSVSIWSTFLSDNMTLGVSIFLSKIFIQIQFLKVLFYYISVSHLKAR